MSCTDKGNTASTLISTGRDGKGLSESIRASANYKQKLVTVRNTCPIIFFKQKEVPRKAQGFCFCLCFCFSFAFAFASIPQGLSTFLGGVAHLFGVSIDAAGEIIIRLSHAKYLILTFFWRITEVGLYEQRR
jgi:hypothetical protein